MRVESPCDWVIERLRAGKPFFAVRVNDGEMAMMYRACEEGKVLGTDANPQSADWALGNALREMLIEINAHPRHDVMVGHCCHDDPGHELNQRFMAEFGTKLEALPEAGGHWPLDGVVDGSTRRTMEALRKSGAVLVAGDNLAEARHLFNGMITAPDANSWDGREEVLAACATVANIHPRGVFAWCAGCGLKPGAWDLWRRFPSTSHVDLGHLFNGACGLRDYGWLQRRDGPWWEPYFKVGGFAEWVRK